jgi:DNA (cytosine-5)-methyltransferase 1
VSTETRIKRMVGNGTVGGASRQPTAVDLFCGVGGMSLGFSYAGFEILGAFDVDPLHVDCYGRNLGHERVYQVDLGQHMNSVMSLLSDQKHEVDVVFGGPPCQGFSVMGRRNSDDERNRLLLAFAKGVKRIQPAYFIMENVPGLVGKHSESHLVEFLSTVEQAGYSVTKPIRILNAADFAVPQHRRRVFILGSREGCAPLGYPSSSDHLCDPCQDRTTVWDAIGDLPFMPNEKYLRDGHRYTRKLKSPRSSYAERLRGERPSFANHLSGQAPGLGGCRITSHNPSTIQRFSGTLPGSVDRKSRVPRLDWNSQCPTLRAGTTSAQGSHTAARPIHPEVPRCITVREAARLQSFPDWFEFHSTIWHSHRQIGNSVPPLLAAAVATQAALTLRSEGGY